MTTEFVSAIVQLTTEKNLPEAVVFEAVETALAAAYKRDYSIPGEVHVSIDRESGSTRVWAEREVVAVEEDIADEDLQVALEEAQRHQATIQIGDTLRQDVQVTPGGGRIAAQTAKQVVLQRLREAERDVVYDEYSGQEGDIVSGIVQRVEARQVIIDLGRTEALLPVSEQVRMEHYRSGQRIRVYVLEVLKGNKGPQVIVSRQHKELVRRLFELEVPEVFKGLVEIKAIARDPGHRTKVAVHSRQEGLDPVGACVGMRGIRIQNVVTELQGERVDVIQWDPDPRRFAAHALSPAQAVAVRIILETNTAEIAVPDAQLSLAIGKGGQNARLAAHLTRMRIDIKPQTAAERLKEEGLGPFAPQEELAAPSVEAAAPPAVAAEAAPAAEAAAGAAAEPAASPGAEPKEAPEEEAEEEEEREPALAGVEVAPAPSQAGKIRFAEEVLTRRPDTESGPPRPRVKRQRYVETDEGLPEDEYAEYVEDAEDDA